MQTPGTTTGLVRVINDLNANGVAFAAMGAYEGAFNSHMRAAKIARSKERHVFLNPDHLAVSLALAASAKRGLRDEKQANALLEEALAVTADSASSFGEGRVYEELALATLYNRSFDRASELLGAIAQTEFAKQDYAAALGRPEREIVDEATIKDRHARIHGVASALFTRSGSLEANAAKRANYLALGMQYAREEVGLRHESGEHNGSGLVHALRMLALAQSAAFEDDSAGYNDVKGNLRQARRLTSDAGVKAAIGLQEAWLEFVREPTNEVAFAPHVLTFFRGAQNIGRDDLILLEPAAKAIGRALGPETDAKVAEIYRI